MRAQCWDAGDRRRDKVSAAGETVSKLVSAGAAKTLLAEDACLAFGCGAPECRSLC